MSIYFWDKEVKSIYRGSMQVRTKPESPDILKTLSISHNVAAALSDFPLYIKPSAITGFWSLTLAEAQSLRFYDMNENELPREIVSADEIYVKTDLATGTGNKIYVDWDWVSSDYLATDTYGRNNTWNSNYKAVYHFEGNANDSTSNGNNGTGYNMTYSGGAGVFNGDGYINLWNTTQLRLQSQSIFGWIKTSVNNDWRLYTKKSSYDGWHNNGLVLWLYQTGALCARLKRGSPASFIDARYSANFYDNNWHYVGYTFSGTQTKVYMDWVLLWENNTTATIYYDWNYPAYIGAESINSSTMGSYFNWNMRGLWIYSWELSSSRISTEYANQSNPATFFGGLQ